MEKRCGTPQSLSLEERLAAEAKLLRLKARGVLPGGIERERLSRKVRQAEAALHINEWLNSPGLRPPK